MAAIARLGLVSDWSHYSELLLKISNPLSILPSDEGAMKVAIKGKNLQGKPETLEWHLFAGKGHGK